MDCCPTKLKWSRNHRKFAKTVLSANSGVLKMSYLFDITVSKTCFIPFFINQHFFASNFTNHRFTCSCIVQRWWEGAAQEIHQPLLSAGQDVSLPSVARPGRHTAGLLLRSALHWGRAQCEWVSVCGGDPSQAAILRWQSPLSPNPLGPFHFIQNLKR